MAPEHDARTRAFYDHEDDQGSPRRRRAAADWGVNEDIFDRMPSRRFKRSDRRAEHREEPEAHRFERRVSGPAEPRSAAAVADDADDFTVTRNPAADEYAEAATRFAAEYDDAAPPRNRTAAEPVRRARRPAESWTDDIPAVKVEEGKRPVDSWLDPTPGKELALAPGESRTIVLDTPGSEEFAAEADVPGRRTVTITGHPDRMPVPRVQRPPRSALERIGASPDRIVGYAVLLGFVLVLIAVLTTGQ
jgi:hypothetical protein